MPYGRIFIDADDLDVPNRDGSLTADVERVQVEFAAADGLDEAYCKHCGELVADYGGDDWRHVNAEIYCDEDDKDTTAEPEARGIDSWCNSAALDFSKDEVTVTISVGDPRGAFAMTIRKLDDGRMVMHVPHEDETFQHMPLKQLHPGTYEVG